MPVSISNRSLLVDGAPFELRGIGYSPLISYAERGTSPPDLFYEAHRSIWERDLAAMASIGARTPACAQQPNS